MLLSQAITEYVTLKSGEHTAWRVSLNVPPQFVSKMQVKTNIVSIGGGQEPWEGEQDFVFEVKDRGALVSVPIKASLQLPPMVAVAKRALRREEIITAEDIDYSPIPQRSTAAPSDYFFDIDALVGKQMRRSIATGQAIESQFVGDALVVARGEFVEVESIAGDIVVTTQGRASESGAVGDLIGIELMPSRKRINASVTAPMKVRVSAVSARTSK
jgi:flagella basal body P-ring formation protein FlgA